MTFFLDYLLQLLADIISSKDDTTTAAQVSERTSSQFMYVYGCGDAFAVAVISNIPFYLS